MSCETTNWVSVSVTIVNVPLPPGKSGADACMVVSLFSKVQVNEIVCGSAELHLVGPSSTVPEPLDAKVAVLSLSQSSRSPDISTPETFALSNFQADAEISSVLVFGVLLYQNSFYRQ